MNWDIENKIVGSIVNDTVIRENTICGVDEAGRGPLACEVYAAAVILPHGLNIENLNDSKKLSPKKREYIYNIIKEKAIAYAIASASEKEIDEINILNASQLAMRRAAESIKDSISFILIDGHIAREFTLPYLCVVKGDTQSPNIAAASILAKVERDRYMQQIDEIYPEYGFKRHKGYPTREHVENILKYGKTPVHRTSFLKKIALRAGIEIPDYE